MTGTALSRGAGSLWVGIPSSDAVSAKRLRFPVSMRWKLSTVVNECRTFPKYAPTVASPGAGWVPLAGMGGGGRDATFPCPNAGTALEAVGYAADSLAVVTMASSSPLSPNSRIHAT